MRKQDSVFSQVCNFINKQPIGTTFKVQDLNQNVNENETTWKQAYNDSHYLTRWYAGHLRKCGALVKNKRGTWTVLAHIPDFVTSTHLRGKNQWLASQ